MTMRPAAALLAAVLAVPAIAAADVKTQERTQIKFEGALGRLVNMFGGRGAREGVMSNVAVKGNRMLSITGDTGELIDLDEEKVYTLDMKGKSYTVITFAEMRKRMEEAMAKAEQQAAATKPEPAPEKQDPGQPQKEFEVDFAITDGAGTKQVAGMDTRESIATITVREKGKTLEESGGLILESHLWMTPKVAALDELNDFRRKYAEKVYGPMVVQAGANMTQAMAMYPQMKDAMAKFADEAKKLNGTPLLTEMMFIAVASPEAQAQQAQGGGGQPPSLGGLLGGLGRFRRGRGNDKPAESQAPAAAQAPGRTTIMTTTTETLQIAPAATDADVALPAGLKQK